MELPHDTTMMQIQEVRNKLISSWSLISSRTELYDSPDVEPSILYTIGKDAHRIIMFSPDGYVSTQLMRHGAIKWESNNLLDGTAEELADATRHFWSYAGTFDFEARGDETSIYISVDLCTKTLEKSDQSIAQLYQHQLLAEAKARAAVKC
ncbi:hypothetical protein F52700_12826 [Fusarium sp. NRRL 52700]|nr:hypothetical protein F52700_12826 [Fusarium sp. NRRL 52700]